MKRFIFLIVMLTTVGHTQSPNWTSVKETNINVGSANSVDIFTNRDGNHIIVQESNNLKYYKMNINGVSGSAVNLEYTSVVTPSITGDETTIYVVYRKNSENYIRTKYSSDGGTNWSYLSTLNYNANSIESVFSNNKLHVTYQVSNVIYYSNYNGYSWSSPVIVSTNETGNTPRIIAKYGGSNDYVYFLYEKSSTDIGKWRSYNVSSNSWGTLYTGYQLNNVLSSNPAGFRVTDSRIIIYYSYRANDPFGTSQYYFDWIVRDLSNNYISEGTPNVTNLTDKIFAAETYDNTMHTAFFYSQIAHGEESGEVAIRRSTSNSGYPDDIIYEYTQPSSEPVFVNISSAGNEVHVIWKDDYGNNDGNNLRYKYDNQNPVAPSNLALSSYNGHPKLTWDENPEADIDYYRIYRKIGSGSYSLYATSGTNEYIDYEETVCSAPPGSRCANEEIAHYEITAKDLTSKESDYSNEVEAVIIGTPPQKIKNNNSVMVYDYKLDQNYPNPFNPTTSINYQVKEKGFVSLKVYDMLGREVANLVNENQKAGQHSVIFNAANLPSGVYIYSIRVNDFVQNNKMTLLK